MTRARSWPVSDPAGVGLVDCVHLVCSSKPSFTKLYLERDTIADHGLTRPFAGLHTIHDAHRAASAEKTGVPPGYRTVAP